MRRACEGHGARGSRETTRGVHERRRVPDRQREEHTLRIRGPSSHKAGEDEADSHARLRPSSHEDRLPIAEIEQLIRYEGGLIEQHGFQETVLVSGEEVILDERKLRAGTVK